ncbi:MAG: sensor histidine kinase [Bacteroidia bacterium]|nr:sensor histidine kinase [Bacteroidia bacterium]
MNERLLKLLFITSMIGFIFVIPQAIFAQERGLDKLILKGIKQVEAQDWEALDKLSQRLLNSYPSSPKAEITAHKFRTELPSAYFRYQPALGDLQKADSLLQAGKAKGNQEKIHFHLAYVNYYLREIRAAEQHFKKALNLIGNPTDHLLHYKCLNGIALLAIYEEKQELSINYLKQAYAVAREHELQEGMGEVLNQLSTIYFSLGKWDSSKMYFEQLLQLKQRNGEYEELISDLTQLGQMLSSQGKFAEGQTYLIQALDIAEKLKDTLLITGILSDIGQSYFKQENWPKTIEYGEKSLEYLIPLGFLQLQASNYKYIGLAQQKLGIEEEAIANLRTASNIYFDQLNQPTEALNIMVIVAEILKEKANYREALQLLNAALAHKSKYSEKPGMLDIELSISNIYLKQGQAKQAMIHLKEAESLSKQLGSNRSLQRTYKLQAEAYGLMGEFSRAYALEKKQSQLRDSIFNQESTRIVQEMESRYQAEQKDRLNAELAVEVANKQLELEKNKSIILAKTQQNYILIGSVTLLLVLFAFFFYNYHNRQKLLKQRMITMEKEAETLKLRAVLQGEEQERQRVARELHDGLGALLASVKVLFQTLEVEFPKALNSQHYRKAEKLLDHACKEVRSISHNMLSSTLKEYGLEQAIHSLVQLTANHYKLNIDHHTHGLENPLSEDVQLSVYRIIQELLRNVVKHAEAKEIFLQLALEDELLLLTVEDDGKGFDSTKLVNEGIGLKNIRARVEYLGGILDMDSSPGNGTTVNIEIPHKPDPTNT